MAKNSTSKWKLIVIVAFFGLFVVWVVVKNVSKIMEWFEREMDLKFDEEPIMSHPTKFIPVVSEVATPRATAVKKVKHGVTKKSGSFSLSDRQEDIYQMIKREVELDMKSVIDKVPGVSDRTLRRDMTKLEKLGLIKQVGRTRNSVYKLKE